MDFQRRFFTIPELAARWNCQENEVIHLAVTRKIFLAVNMTPFSPLPISGWWNLFLPDEIATLLTGQQLFYVSYFHNPSDEKNRDSFVRFKKEDGKYRAFEFDRSDVIVLGKDVEKFEKDTQRSPADEFIGYHKTMNILEERWQATEEELAAWIFCGPELGGVAAYIGAYNPPEPFSFSYALSCRNYLPLLNKCCFRSSDIENFKPVERYITGKNLFKRWEHVRGGPSSFIRARIEESRLLPFHPTFGVTREVFKENANDIHQPTLEEGLFSLEHIKLIEAKEGLFPPEEDSLITHDKNELLSHLLKGRIVPQQQKFRGLCVDELRKFARRWVEDSPEIPIKRIMLYEYHSKWSVEFKRHDQNFRCPLYVVVFELPEFIWPPTSQNPKNWPPPLEDICVAYPKDENGRTKKVPWQDFLKKLDNIPGQRFQENSRFFYPGFEQIYNSTPANTWRHDWLFMAVDDVNNLPEDVDRNGPSLVLLPLEQVEEALTPSPKKPTADQAAPVGFPQTGEVPLTNKELATLLDPDTPPSPDSLHRWRTRRRDPLPHRTEGQRKYYKKESVLLWYDNHKDRRKQARVEKLNPKRLK